MKNRREIVERLAFEEDDKVAEVLQWVLESPDCALCEHRNRFDLEIKLFREETTPHFLEQKHGWLSGTVIVHMEEHIEYDPVKDALIESLRNESISTLNMAENTAQKLNEWIEEIELQKDMQGISSEWIADATSLTSQLGNMLRLMGQLKKEIGVDSQLLLADAKMNSVMGVLVDTLREQPEVLDQIELRLAGLKTPRTIDADFEVTDE
ncbi:MAG: hypothetical protein HOC79_01810 [Euryarchaeota archaeon]|nr:hypothetical protein [Euryarchaeota archaeon]